MATGGLYGTSSNAVLSYFTWFVFQQSASQPSTPTGGTWNFQTNVGTPPTGWTNTPAIPTTLVWMSMAIVSSQNSVITWSTPSPWSGVAGTFIYPSAGIVSSTGTSWSTAYSTTGSGTVIPLATSPSIATPTFTGTITGSQTTGAITYGALTYSDVNNLATFQSSQNNYIQMVLQNSNSGAVASTNLNVSNNAGTSSTNFGEFGINSTGFTGTGAFNQAGYTYLASASTDLAIGTYGSNAIHFVVNSGATDAMTISNTGVVSFGTALPVSSGGTGATTAPTALTNLGAAASGANSDITSLSALTSINSGYLYGNRVINGAQEIDQTNSGAAVTPASGTIAYATDMFGVAYTQFSKLTFQQVVDAPAGLKNSLKLTVASQYSPVATDAFYLQMNIEGKDIIDFQMGSAGAATFTLSQWVKGSVAGNYAVSIRNAAANRTYIGLISVTTSWAQVKITLQGDVTGTWATDNTSGLQITWDLGSGSNFNTAAGLWQAGNFLRTSGSVTFVNQVAGSTLNITGVDCRLGSVAPTVFERRANELQLAQRYYFKYSSTLGQTINASISTGNSFYLKTTMRAQPTVDAGATFSASAGSAGTVGTVASGTDGNALFVYNSAANWTVGANIVLTAGFSARLF